jgi:hypothetical protein
VILPLCSHIAVAIMRRYFVRRRMIALRFCRHCRLEGSTLNILSGTASGFLDPLFSLSFLMTGTLRPSPDF